MSWGMPLSLCKTTFCVVLHTDNTALKTVCMSLPINPRWNDVGGLTVLDAFDWDWSDHHVSAPYVATEITNESIAVINALGAAPLITEFRRRKFRANSSTLLHQVDLWSLSESVKVYFQSADMLSKFSRYTSHYYSTGVLFLPPRKLDYFRPSGIK